MYDKIKKLFAKKEIKNSVVEAPVTQKPVLIPGSMITDYDHQLPFYGHQYDHQMVRDNVLRQCREQVSVNAFEESERKNRESVW